MNPRIKRRPQAVLEQSEPVRSSGLPSTEVFGVVGVCPGWCIGVAACRAWLIWSPWRIRMTGWRMTRRRAPLRVTRA